MRLVEVLCPTHAAIGSSIAHLQAGIRRLGAFLVVWLIEPSLRPSSGSPSPKEHHSPVASAASSVAVSR